MSTLPVFFLIAALDIFHFYFQIWFFQFVSHLPHKNYAPFERFLADAYVQLHLTEVHARVIIYMQWQTQDGDTALILAAQNDRIECVRLLLEAGAEKNAKNDVREIKFRFKFRIEGLCLLNSNLFALKCHFYLKVDR